MSDNFLITSYLNPLLEQGFIEVPTIDLPDGKYCKMGGGYSFKIFENTDKINWTFGTVFEDIEEYFTGYELITQDGIRGFYNGNVFYIKDGLPYSLDINGNIDNRIWVWKIMSIKSKVRNDKIDKIMKEYMGIGNSVKVTHQNDEDINKIGIITENHGDFVNIDFGTHERKMNVSSLFDLSID